MLIGEVTYLSVIIRYLPQCCGRADGENKFVDVISLLVCPSFWLTK